MREDQNPTNQNATEPTIIVPTNNSEHVVSPALSSPEPQHVESASTGTSPTRPMPDETMKNTLIVGSQLQDTSRDKKISKKFIIKVLVVLITLAIILAVLVLTSVIPLGKFKTITYDNGMGDSYSLKFYSQYSIKDSTQILPSSSAADVDSNFKVLASKISVNGKSPLTMWAQSSKSDTSTASFSNNDCTRNNLPKVFDIRIDYLNADVAVCAIKQQDLEVMYLVAFNDSNTSTLVMFSQDMDWAKLLSSPEAAREGLTKVGLEDYQDDIKTILASFKPNN